MATSFVDVLLQLRTELGADVLSGGKIYTYEAGTTTPLATYTDVSGSSANTNPVILDSSGSAVIRQTDGVAYKWIVYDSDDNLLWTRDNITVGLSPSQAGDGYLVHYSFSGTPGASQFLAGHIFSDEVLFPIDFEGAQGGVQTNPGAEYVLSVKKNGAEVGTVTIDTSGSHVFETTSHTTVTFEPGDEMAIIGPSSAGSAADLFGTLPGTVQ